MKALRYIQLVCGATVLASGILEWVSGQPVAAWRYGMASCCLGILTLVHFIFWVVIENRKEQP